MTSAKHARCVEFVVIFRWAISRFLNIYRWIFVPFWVAPKPKLGRVLRQRFDVCSKQRPSTTYVHDNDL